MEIILAGNESRVLKGLFALSGEATTDELSRRSGLREEQVTTAAYSLRDKTLLEIEELKSQVLGLTTEGARHAALGLPERRLVDWLKERGAAAVSEAAEAGLEPWELPIALAWARKKGWIQIASSAGGRVLVLTGEGKRAAPGLDEELIAMVGSGKARRSADLPDTHASAVGQLASRGLLITEAFTKRVLRLSELGRRAAMGEVPVVTEVSTLTGQLISSRQWQTVRLKEYDVSLPSYPIYGGRKHFVRQALEHMRRIWIEMGFREMKGPLVETCFWCFDALYVPQDHPARDMQDTFYMSTPSSGRLPERRLIDAVKAAHQDGWSTGSTGWMYRWNEAEARRCVLRTHTTCLSARTLAALRESELPAKFFSVGRSFRNEAVNWRRLCEFYQTDGIVVDDSVNFTHLLGYLKRYFARLGFDKPRFRPAYFPYTEPSVEIEVFHPTHQTWMELGGAGMFRPEVVKPLFGRDIPVLAWGPGLSRMMMMPYGIRDIRELHSNDLGMLREAKVWPGE
ncbi:MAG: phenylalanine--tRNA ligase subunit alpha [Candidatus Bathyarchaeia archaeon]